MGLVTEYYLSSALEELERKSRRVDHAWENSTGREYLEAFLDYDLQEGEPVEFSHQDEVREGEVVDRRPLVNLTTGLHPGSDTTYRVESGGRTITVSEDDILYERSNT